jgi:hypothetical protein
MGRKQTEDYLKKLGTNILGKKQSVHLDRLFEQIDQISRMYPTRIVQGNLIMNNSEQKTSNKYVLPIKDDGQSVFVGFANNPVANGANPSNVAILNPASGAACWVDDNKVVNE